MLCESKTVCPGNVFPRSLVVTPCAVDCGGKLADFGFYSTPFTLRSALMALRCQLGWRHNGFVLDPKCPRW